MKYVDICKPEWFYYVQAGCMIGVLLLISFFISYLLVKVLPKIINDER